MVKRVAVYIRTSTTEQDTSLQKRELLEYLATRKDWQLLDVYEDQSSGTNDKRPQLQRLLKDCRQGKVRVVLCWKLDRFFRSLKMLVDTLQELDERSVLFVSLKDQIDLGTSSGRLMMHMLGAFAEFEAALIKERVLAGLANARAKGVKIGRPKQRDDAAIRKMRAEGLSFKQISSALDVSVSSIQAALRPYQNP